MKKILASAVLALASTGAMAADTYVFGSVGQTDLEANGTKVADDVSAGAGVGFKVHPNVGVELGYTHFGSDSSGDSDAFSASVVGRYALTPQLTARGKVGVARLSVYDKADQGAHDTVPVFGVGAEYGLDSKWTLVGEYERFDGAKIGGFDVDADRFSVGVQYKF